MAEPNVRSASTVKLRTTCVSLATVTGTTATMVIQNPGDSSAVYKISAVTLANKTSGAVNATMQLYTATSSTVAFSLVQAVSVPGNATLLTVGRDNSAYLPEGHTLRGFASSTAAIDCIVSYEEIS